MGAAAVAGAVADGGADNCVTEEGECQVVSRKSQTQNEITDGTHTPQTGNVDQLHTHPPCVPPPRVMLVKKSEAVRGQVPHGNVLRWGLFEWVGASVLLLRLLA